MSSDSARRIFNTNERASSSDQTRQTDLNHRMVLEAFFASVAQGRLESGTIWGLEVTVDAGAKTVTVAKGLGLYFDTAISFPDSPYRWIEVTTPIVTAVPAATGFNRWDVVEIAPGTSVTITTSVDIWDPSIPPNGAFAPESKDKEVQSIPTISIRTGADNAPDPPNFPAGVTAVIPLAYVFVDTLGDVDGGVTGIVQSRPILQPVGSTPDNFSAPDSNGLAIVEGGGIQTGASATTVEFYHCKGRFENSRQDFLISNETILTCNVVDTWENENKPAGDAAGYGWAFPVPYQSGYDALAGREFIVGSAVRTHFFCIDNAADSQFGCGIVLSTDHKPFSADAQTSPQGGGDPSPMNINDWPFRTGTTRATVPTKECVFLGAFDWKGASNVAMKQQYLGNGRVILAERYCGHDIFGGTAAGVGLDFDIRTPLGSFGSLFEAILPQTAHVFHCSVGYNATSPASEQDNRIEIIDAETAFSGPSGVLKSRRHIQQSGSSLGAFKWLMDIVVNDVGVSGRPNAKFIRSDGNVTEFSIHVVAYTDKILSSR